MGIIGGICIPEKLDLLSMTVFPEYPIISTRQEIPKALSDSIIKTAWQEETWL